VRFFPIGARRRTRAQRAPRPCPPQALCAPAREADVRALEILLLGRSPENAALDSARHGRPRHEAIGDILRLPEFHERVIRTFLSDNALPHRSLEAADFALARDWAAEAGLAALAPETDWLELFAGFMLAEPVAALCRQVLPAYAGKLQQKAEAIAGSQAARERERSERIIDAFAAAIPSKEEDQFYFQAHRKRYQETLAAMFQHNISGEYALEIGTTFMFCHFVEDHLGFRQCDVTAFTPEFAVGKIRSILTNIGAKTRTFRAFNLDIQNEPYPVADATYDYIMFFETLEHLPTDPMFAMQEINRVLKNSGLLFITTPNITGLGRVSEILEGRHPYFFPLFNGSSDRHNLEYSPELLEGLVEAAGFEIVRMWTPHVWEDPDPEMMRFLKHNGFPTRNRGDCLFCLARKIGLVRDRYPSLLYSDYSTHEAAG
jgi:hypothetical protein